MRGREREKGCQKLGLFSPSAFFLHQSVFSVCWNKVSACRFFVPIWISPQIRFHKVPSVFFHRIPVQSSLQVKVLSNSETKTVSLEKKLLLLQDIKIEKEQSVWVAGYESRVQVFLLLELLHFRSQYPVRRFATLTHHFPFLENNLLLFKLPPNYTFNYIPFVASTSIKLTVVLFWRRRVFYIVSEIHTHFLIAAVDLALDTFPRFSLCV